MYYRVTCVCVCEVIVFKLVCVCVKLLYCVDVCKVIVYASVCEVIVCVLLRKTTVDVTLCHACTSLCM